MKKYILCTLPIAFLVSCAVNHSKFDYNKSSNPWIDAFKDQVFFASLREGYKSDTIFKLIEKKDAFNPYDGLSLEALQKARQIGKDLVKNMPPAAMCDDCDANVNYYMANSLHYYGSRELDSIAKAEFKKFKKQDKHLWGQH